MALVSHPLRQFSRLPCWYYWWWNVRNFECWTLSIGTVFQQSPSKPVNCFMSYVLQTDMHVMTADSTGLSFFVLSLFVCRLSEDAVNDSDSVTSNYWIIMNTWLETMWNEAVVANFKVLSQHLYYIYLYLSDIIIIIIITDITPLYVCLFVCLLKFLY
jgi:hypothetical protein